MLAVNSVVSLIDSIDEFLYQSAIDILDHRKHDGPSVYKARGPPTDQDASPEVFKLYDTMFGSIDSLPYDVIHVAGTNGKGSVCVKLSNVFTRFYSSQQRTVGLLTSPHVNTRRERVQVNHQYISKYDFFRGIDGIVRTAQELDIVLTSAEIQALLAFWYFNERQVDIAIVECFVGGKYCPTNIIRQPLLSIITSISMDHMSGLGSTLESIARHKCGIIKHGVPCLIGRNVSHDFVRKYIDERQLNAPLFQLNETQCIQCRTYDDINIEVGKMALHILQKSYDFDRLKIVFDGIEKDPAQIEALLKIKQSGRLDFHELDFVDLLMKFRHAKKYQKYTQHIEALQTKDTNVVIGIDASHNPEGLNAFFKSIRQQYPNHTYVVVYACKQRRSNFHDCLREIDVNAHFTHFTTGAGLKPVSELLQYPFTHTTIVRDNGTNPAGQVDLCVMHALSLCVQQNNKEDHGRGRCMVLCVGTMFFHPIVNQMIGVDTVYDTPLIELYQKGLS